MSAIVCAIRGGKESHATINRAIDLAEEMKLPLNYLYVVNEDDFSDIQGDQLKVTLDWLFHAGNAILSIAVSKSKDIKADGIIRSGKIREKILALCQELDADYLVVGRPGINEKRNMFTNKKLKRFCKRVERKSNARVLVI
ncbi:MAG: universal stress protein [Chloroflexota bacterium]|nr:universal stress protein [Chloroflexota bacterium]